MTIDSTNQFPPFSMHSPLPSQSSPHLCLDYQQQQQQQYQQQQQQQQQQYQQHQPLLSPLLFPQSIGGQQTPFPGYALSPFPTLQDVLGTTMGVFKEEPTIAKNTLLHSTSSTSNASTIKMEEDDNINTDLQLFSNDYAYEDDLKINPLKEEYLLSMLDNATTVENNTSVGKFTGSSYSEIKQELVKKEEEREDEIMQQEYQKQLDEEDCFLKRSAMVAKVGRKVASKKTGKKGKSSAKKTAKRGRAKPATLKKEEEEEEEEEEEVDGDQGEGCWSEEILSMSLQALKAFMKRKNLTQKEVDSLKAERRKFQGRKHKRKTRREQRDLRLEFQRHVTYSQKLKQEMKITETKLQALIMHLKNNGIPVPAFDAAGNIK